MKAFLLKIWKGRRVQAFELLCGLALLGLAPAAWAQERGAPRQATDLEVVNGTDVKAYVNPKQYQANMSGGAGGGISQNQFTAGLNAGTNAMKATTLGASGTTKLQALGADSLVVTNAADFRGATSAATLSVTNINVSTNGVPIITMGTNGLQVNTGNSNSLGGSTYFNSGFVTSNHVYLATTDGSTSWANNTLYTNGPYRAVMRLDISSNSGATGSPNEVFFHYTNNSVGRLDQAVFTLASGAFNEQEMNVELDPGATFKIDFIISTGGSISLFNMRLNPSF